MARGVATVLWLAFALMVVSVEYVLLAACDLGLNPVFGLRYCKPEAPTRAGRLRDEQDRERALRARLHEAQLRRARLSGCPPPNSAETPPRAKAGEELKIPVRREDLQGCWQSDRGDIQVATDDEEHRPTGKVRQCLCFSRSGRGRARVTFTDGDRCEAPLSVQIGAGELVMRHGPIPCERHGPMVPAKIVCRGGANGEAAICDTENLGKMRDRLSGEKFHKVDNAHCGWAPGG